MCIYVRDVYVYSNEHLHVRCLLYLNEHGRITRLISINFLMEWDLQLLMVDSRIVILFNLL